MKVSAEFGVVYLQFEPKDWKEPAGGASMMISGIKAQMRPYHHLRNPRGFKLDSGVWSFSMTAENVTDLDKLVKEFLPGEQLPSITLNLPDALRPGSKDGKATAGT